jgi:hypothetical protein
MSDGAFSIKFTGLKEAKSFFAKSPIIFEQEIGVAIGRSLAMFGTEIKKRTPVDTGLLRSSIGSESFGYQYVRGLTGGIGTNIKYAVYVNDGNGKHATGQRQFIEGGLEAGTPFFEQEIMKALERLASKINQQ